MDDLTNLRFADDVMLFAKTLPQLQKMLGDIITEAGTRGLELHPDKAKILSNTVRRTGRSAARYVDINGLRIEIIPWDGDVKYLGRKISLADPNKTEIENRIAAAWRSFMSLKNEFTNKSYTINRRLELFNCVVAPAALYGCAARALTTAEEGRLLRAERRMLRMIIGHSRRWKMDAPADEREVDPWLDWVKRTTREAEQRMDNLGIESWISQYRRRKWRYAGQLIRGSQDKWSNSLLRWMPEFEVRSSRCQGRPRTRWSDALQAITSKMFGPQEWTCVASIASTWNDLEDNFIKY